MPAVQLSIPNGFKCVGVYHKVRCYGGPEEGGWFYDGLQHLRSAVIPQDADERLLLQQDEAEQKDTPDAPCPEWMEDTPLFKGESLSSGEFITIVEEEGPAQHDNSGDAAPRYE